MAFVSGVVLVPLYLRHIPSDLYGAWQASGNVLMWATMLDPGLSFVIQQRVATAYGKQDREAVAGWVATGLWTAGGVSILVLSVGLLSSYQLVEWLQLPTGVSSSELESAFRWGTVGASLMLYSYSLSAINQGLQSSLGTGLVSALASVARLTLVMLLLQNGLGLSAIAIASVFMGTALVAGNLAYLMRRLRTDSIPTVWLPSRLGEMGGLLSFMTVGRVAGILVNNVDLVLVARTLGPESVNTLRFTRTATEISRTIVDRPAVAMYSSLTHLVGAGGVARAREIVLRLLRFTTWTTILFASGFIALNGAFLRLWVGDRFYAGPTVNTILVGTFILATVTTVMSGLAFAAGNIRASNLGVFAQALVYLPLLFAGATYYGLAGVAGASAVSVAVTQAWYIPRALADGYGLGRREWAGIAKNLVQTFAAGAFPAVLFAATEPQTWKAFAGAAIIHTLTYLLILLALSRDCRAELRGGVVHLYTWGSRQIK